MRIVNTFAIVLLVMSAIDARKPGTRYDYAPWVEMQTSAHIAGTAVAYDTAGLTDSTYRVKTYDGDSTYAKGVIVSDTSSGGYLMVHLVDDPDTVWCTVKLLAADWRGLVFNKVHQRGTTIPLGGVIFALCPKQIIQR